MKKLIILLLLLSFQFGSAQDVTEHKFEIGLHYPLSTGRNFIVIAYDGLLGLDFRYQFADTELISPKFALSIDYFNYNLIDDVNGGAFVLKPKVIGEFNLKSIPQLKPYVSVGYSIFTTSLNASNVNFDFGNPNPDVQPNGDRFTDTISGINYGFGVAYDITETFFVEVSADFIKLDLDENVSGNRYNENIHTLNMGVGLRF